MVHVITAVVLGVFGSGCYLFGIYVATRHFTKVASSASANKPRYAICHRAVAIEYKCLNDGLPCKGQCGATTDQAC